MQKALAHPVAHRFDRDRIRLQAQQPQIAPSLIGRAEPGTAKAADLAPARHAQACRLSVEGVSEGPLDAGAGESPGASAASGHLTSGVLGDGSREDQPTRADDGVPDIVGRHARFGISVGR